MASGSSSRGNSNRKAKKNTAQRSSNESDDVPLPEKKDLNDSLDLKRTVDEEVCRAIEHDLGFPENHKISNLKLLLMLAAVIIALVGQFYPCDPRHGDVMSRGIVYGCVGGYFALAGVLTLIAVFVDGNCIMFTHPRAEKGKTQVALKVTAEWELYDKMYKLTIHNADGSCSPVSKTTSLEEYFDEEGLVQRDTISAHVNVLVNELLENSETTKKHQ